MEIIKLEVSGFRSLKEIVWEPGKLNVLIGANGTGKSNILRLLELLAAAAEGKLSRHVQSSGGMEAIIWDGRMSSIDIQLTTTPVGMEEGPEVYLFKLERIGSSGSFQIARESLTNLARMNEGKSKNPFKLLEREWKHAVVFDETEHRLIPPDGSISEDETLLSVAGVPLGANKWTYMYRKQLSEVSIYQDIHVHSTSSIRQPSVTRFEKRLASDGQNLVTVLHTLYTSDRDFRTQIDEGMNAAFGDEYEELTFPPAADQRIQLRIRWKGLKNAQSAADLSDGTLRFLLLMAILSSPDIAPVVAIDEPEIGLHPRMLSIVAEYAVEAASRSQIIFTTHSPEFLSAFNDEIPTTSVLTWSNGITHIENLSPDDLNYWLQEYSLGQLFKSGELEDLR